MRGLSVETLEPNHKGPVAVPYHFGNGTSVSSSGKQTIGGCAVHSIARGSCSRDVLLTSWACFRLSSGCAAVGRQSWDSPGLGACHVPALRSHSQWVMSPRDPHVEVGRLSSKW